MPKTIMTQRDARENFYQLLEDVNQNHSEIHIISERNENDAVLISKKDWDSIQETLFLEQTGVLAIVRKREGDNSGYSDIDTMDWEAL